MVAGAIAGNISAEATTPTGNTFAEAMRGAFPATAHSRMRLSGSSFSNANGERGSDLWVDFRVNRCFGIFESGDSAATDLRVKLQATQCFGHQ